MPTYEFVLKFIQDNFDNVVVKKNQINCRCLLCGDSQKSSRKRRFNLKYNDKESVFHCFNCGESGNFYKLYSIIKKVDIKVAYKECESFDNIVFKSNNKPKSSTVLPKIQTFNEILLDCVSPKDISIVAIAYLTKLAEFRKSRHIPDNIKLYIAYKNKFKNRIIIPVTNNGDIIYFQGRRIFADMQPKYLNPDFPKEYVIPNIDKFDLSMPIIITEGLLDCYSIGSQATSCFGKEINDDFIDRINCKKFNLVIAMDNDADGYKAIKKIIGSKHGRKMRYFLMPEKYKQCKDINELACTLRLNIYDFIINNTIDYGETLVKIKLDRWRG